MTRLDRRGFMVATGAAAVCAASCRSVADPDAFRCPPCGCTMDDVMFEAPGVCPDCDMTLAPAQESNLGFEPTRLAPYGGVFTVGGAPGRTDAPITVHYYLPENFTPASKILLILPGAGRDSDEYRNLWLASARKAGALVAALGYPEDRYGFAGYHLGGVAEAIKHENVSVEQRARSTVLRMRDEDLALTINRDRRQWAFQDLDRVFERLQSLSGSAQERYAVFGHSAGAQFLHRMVLFHPESKADQIVAANAGLYTLPDPETPFPLGLLGTGVTLETAFAARLTLLLGERDNDDDAGGTLLHTPAVDRQGLGRLDRGRTFHAAGAREAERLGTAFSWDLVVVPDVGHDSRAMVAAAAKILL